jgi:hypothetical protein
MPGMSRAFPPRQPGYRRPAAATPSPAGMSPRERSRRMEAVKAAFEKARARRLGRR